MKHKLLLGIFFICNIFFIIGIILSVNYLNQKSHEKGYEIGLKIGIKKGYNKYIEDFYIPAPYLENSDKIRNRKLKEKFKG